MWKWVYLVAYPAVVDVASNANGQPRLGLHRIAERYLGARGLRVRLVAEFDEGDRKRNQQPSDENVEDPSDVAQRQFVPRRVLWTQP